MIWTRRVSKELQSVFSEIGTSLAAACPTFWDGFDLNKEGRVESVQNSVNMIEHLAAHVSTRGGCPAEGDAALARARLEDDVGAEGAGLELPLVALRPAAGRAGSGL